MVMLWMESVPSLRCQTQKIAGQDHGPQKRRAGIGDVDVEMEEVRDAGAEDGDGVGQEPVGEGPVAAGAELQHQPDDEQHDLGTATFDVAERLQIVRGGLAAGRGEDLDHPEDEDDLGDLGGNRRGKQPTDQRQLSFWGPPPLA